MYTVQPHPQSIMRSRSHGAIEFIVMHYTANDGDTARNNLAFFARENRIVGAHYFVDRDEVCSSTPDLKVAQHCGRPDGRYQHPLCRNGNSIGIEMCSRMDSKGNYYIPQKTQENAAGLVRDLMKKYNVPIEKVVRHYDVTGKICPAPMIDRKSWNEFLALIRKEDEEEMKYYQSVNEMPIAYHTTVRKLVHRGVIQGTEGGLHLSDDMCRVLVFNDRAGLYGA